MLRDAKVCGVDLPQVYAIASSDERFQQVYHPIAVFGRKETFDVLKEKCWRSVTCDDGREERNERVPVIPMTSRSSGGEPLARRPSRDHICGWKYGVFGDLSLNNVKADVALVGFDGGAEVIDGQKGGEAGSL
jgi:hypothetical protein